MPSIAFPPRLFQMTLFSLNSTLRKCNFAYKTEAITVTFQTAKGLACGKIQDHLCITLIFASYEVQRFQKINCKKKLKLTMNMVNFFFLCIMSVRCTLHNKIYWPHKGTHFPPLTLKTLVQLMKYKRQQDPDAVTFSCLS